MEIPTLSVVFLAGVATILTPCCLPLLPPLLSGSVGHRLRPVAIISGSLLSFTALGLLVGAAGAISPETLRTPAFLAIVAFGAVMIDEDLYRTYSTYASRLSGSAAQRAAVFDEGKRPLGSAFSLGVLLGVIWLPCVGPVLGAVLAYAATTGAALESGFFLFVYGLGFSMPLLGVAYGSKIAGRSIGDRLGALGRDDVLRRSMGVILLISGVALLFEVDRILLSAL
ncbi:cytochrome c biogenesis CcdA family protein [Natrarchaeobaculum sulfurireducens]|uniref:Cytochrome C-type biogenesis protein (CcdA),conjectural n=1 Tax=Natrarchaeobaculum sulfurireducens TaxID=2044521 RepID=A0A346PST7_9EURY|nr:cytochrome c biogenesis protein CcdA [Natrarchaeobaculum sulfurireducens]AXR77447.1 Cytochrome c biogenesis protein [Natrarchaeobaculum sulfurireducens]AXR82582.1 cytochrome C-type biogenesis protein (ccdA),conjectural [Natrarchaeobaculum sulfurireducens]